MTAQEVKRLHSADLGLWLQVEEAAWRIAKVNKLPLCHFSPLPKHRTLGWYGICYYTDKHVQMAVRSISRCGRWNPRRTDAYKITEVLAHELAHLRHPHHGPKFTELHGLLLLSAVKLGIAKHIIDLTGNSDDVKYVQI